MFAFCSTKSIIKPFIIVQPFVSLWKAWISYLFTKNSLHIYGGGGGAAHEYSLLSKIKPRQETRAGIFKKSMGARNRGGIGLSYRPARLHRLAEFVP
jgi:hypothetical protein